MRSAQARNVRKATFAPRQTPLAKARGASGNAPAGENMGAETIGSSEAQRGGASNLRLLCSVLGAQAMGVRPTIDQAIDDWPELDRLVALHRCEALMVRALGHAAMKAPEAIAQRWRGAEARLAVDTGAYLSTVTRLWPRLQAEGLQAAVFKGPVLQHQLYGEYFVRRAGDLDLLVAEADFARAGQILIDLGWRLAPPCRTLWWRLFLGEQHYLSDMPGRTTIDLHYRIQQPGSPAPRQAKDFLDHTISVAIGGVEVQTVSLCNAALIAAISIVKALLHRAPSLRHVADLGALFHRLSDDMRAELWERARAQGLTNTLNLGVRAVEECLGISIQAGEKPHSHFTASLRMMIGDPQSKELVWPRRVEFLWALLDDKWRFPVELSRRWAAGAARSAATLGV